jgi:hypothetical protein
MSPDDSSPDSDEQTPTTQKWWFSNMLQVVAGGAVIAFQWELITTGQANWLNWVVAALGLVILALGARGWFSNWRRQQMEQENDR